jgi:hypothetical protein
LLREDFANVLNGRAVFDRSKGLSSTSPVWVAGDPPQSRQILHKHVTKITNLVVVVEFTTPGGQIDRRGDRVVNVFLKPVLELDSTLNILCQDVSVLNFVWADPRIN